MKLRIRSLLAISALFSIVLTVFTIICYSKYVSPMTVEIPVNSSTARVKTVFMLVDPSTVMTVLSVCCFVCIAAVFVIPFFIMKKHEIISSTKNNMFTVFTSSLLGFLFAGYVINSFIKPVYSMMEIKQILDPVFRMIETNQLLWGNIEFFKIIIAGLYIAAVIIAIPCAVYFFTVALKGTVAPDEKTGILAIFPILWLCLRVVYYFMETSARVNIAGRRLFILSVCLTALFFLHEAKLLVPSEKSIKEKKRHAKLYIALGCSSVITLITSQVSTVYLQAFRTMPVAESYLINGIYITLALYIFSRLFSIEVKEAE